ncbi:methionine adenosyltransferase domain-containing protein [Prevotella sp.]|uniref:methionine adenosyltransferase domain-containing protein n=1 Tax=Prevotella sp. TaxID=59823 RepID=UPI003DA24C1D
MEIQIKDQYVTLGGEVSSNAVLGEEGIVQTVRDGGDQGIFFGYAEPNDDTFGMPLDHTLAKRVNHLLFESGIGGLDIKTQVVTDDDVVKEIIVAIPLRDSEDSSKVEELVRNSVKGDYHLIINGTGVFRKHSSIADCGVTGRKLVVDFYGGNARIGGGAPFSKDGSKADLTLNLLVRYLAKKAFKSGKAVETAIACCIGKKEIIVTSHILGADIVKSEHLSISPSELIDTFDLNRPIFGSMCMWGLFGEFQQDKKWEQAV